MMQSKKVDKFEMQQRNYFTKLKKEPEKNLTNWDYLLKEMAWLANDFASDK